MLNIKTLFAIALSLVLIMGLVGTASALEIRAKDNLIIAKDEVIDDDLIISAGKVTVDGTINGDLIVSAANVIINGTVNGSVMASGQTLLINGTVNGTVYSLGASLSFGPTAVVKRNVIYLGAALKTEKGSVIGRDVIAAGYQVLLAGDVVRDAKVSGGAVELNGKIGRDVFARVGEPSPGFGASLPAGQIPGMPLLVDPGLRVSVDSKIGGKLDYASSVEQTDSIKAKPEGGVIYTKVVDTGEKQKTDSSSGNVFFNWMLGRVRELFALLLIGLLTVWRIPNVLRSLTEMIQEEAPSSAGWGIVVFFGGYIGTVLVALAILVLAGIVWAITLGELTSTVISLGFSLLSAAFAIFWVLMSYGSKIVVAYFVGMWLAEKFVPQLKNKFIWMLIGVLLYVMAASLPILGWFVGAAAIVMGLGAMWLVWREWRDGTRGELLVNLK